MACNIVRLGERFGHQGNISEQNINRFPLAMLLALTHVRSHLSLSTVCFEVNHILGNPGSRLLVAVSGSRTPHVSSLVRLFLRLLIPAVYSIRAVATLPHPPFASFPVGIADTIVPAGR